jgi:hypothetical protein
MMNDLTTKKAIYTVCGQRGLWKIHSPVHTGNIYIHELILTLSFLLVLESFKVRDCCSQ